jgi:DNA-binding HxlR family transcriptional regulator
MQNAAGPAFLADCPTRLAVEIISDKWAVLVLFGLSQQPRRHGELAGLIGGISRKVLTQTLRRLQQYGLVERHAEAPRQVHYRLTDLGRTLVEPIEVLNNWARDYGEAIADFQEAAEAAASAQARDETGVDVIALPREHGHLRLFVFSVMLRHARPPRGPRCGRSGDRRCQRSFISL